MPRANRNVLPGHVRHITHRCHQKAFLLKFARDRQVYLRWLFEAKKHFGRCVLNYTVTSNHIHLLVNDTAPEVIPRSMQLIAGRTAQDYNQRKVRKGAFWEHRYHATAIEADDHLRRCLIYIDLNMVRAGVVKHPAEWAHSDPAGVPGIAWARAGAKGSAADLRSGIGPCSRRRSHQAGVACGGSVGYLSCT